MPTRTGRYVALLRGINVGGANVIPMTALRASFEALGLRDVTSFIASGNVLFRSEPTDARALVVPRAVVTSISTREGVDTAEAGASVIYFSRLIARASQSHLPRLISMPVYKQLTIRNWNTTTKLLTLLDA